jgi:hypothetical protein
VLFDEVAVIRQFSTFIAPARVRRPAANEVMEAVASELRHRGYVLMPVS